MSKAELGKQLFKCLKCHYKKNSRRDFMLMKIVCSEVSSNLSSQAHDYTDCREGGAEASLMVSPLVVAGIVIGLVLFLSCVTIIVGSLRKDGRLHNPHLRPRDVSDGLSHGGSVGELRWTCIAEFPPAFDFSSYAESPSHGNMMYPDAPPHYEECVRPGATEIYLPTDDPPPYSLTDPCLGGALLDELGEQWGGASWLMGSTGVPYVPGLPLASVSLSGLPLEDVPPYEAIVRSQNQHIPLIPTDLLKHTVADGSPRGPTTDRIL
ncbi:protein BEAN1-like isoform X1 [Paramormyrops kingsleyae]|uniref:protein BEAN1-like isoform X1 n=1 Tax=Paramormyrops kingsleyae TaxID=1676925 RepID=UPI000CD639F7|nr:protein BEAN1-like isoform X1 [Paramormyrops kingsleyae]XP_023694040.1 protein BEAN1-like isoform X1 [Paramormyrops kingsleyae]XP_023694041.1 protein BEAN1-like isoform X1 [Paramormyrops kingsleyae]XP_023694043.1 protein BEAN1-like isoform X1 [Paramormyrops kingsleyae]